MKWSVLNPRIAGSALAASFAMTACAGTDPAAPVARPVASVIANPPITTQLCHAPQRGGQLIEVSDAARGAHFAHGDYIARLVVDPSVDRAQDTVHFGRITDAVLAARATRIAHSEKLTAACRITIDVAAGTYTGSFDLGADGVWERFPIIIDVPDVTLRGALQMQVDARGRATGEGTTTTRVSSLVPDRPTVFLPNTEAMIVVVGHPGGFAGNGTVIEGFAFQSGRSDGTSGGMGIIALRARDLVIRGNRFEPGLTTAGDLRSSSARISENHVRQLGVNCTFCLAGPGEYVATGNRFVDGGLGGIYVSATLAHMPFSLGAAPVTAVEPDVLPPGATVTATIRNNDIRGHARLPVGFAVRVLALGPGSSQVPQVTEVFIEENDMIGNTFGVIADAGFPSVNSQMRADLDIRMKGNRIEQSCQANLLIAFTRHTGALDVTSNPYLRNATFRLELSEDLRWEDAWFAHPSGLANTLIVNGVPAANGIRQFFDAATCPGLGG